MTDTECEPGSVIYTLHKYVTIWNHPSKASRTYQNYLSSPIDHVSNGKFPDKVSAPAEVNLNNQSGQEGLQMCTKRGY